MGSTRRTLLIDGNNILMRAFHASQGRVALTADGANTAPLLIFINMVSKYVKAEDPHRLVVCWDGGPSAFRRSIYFGYKSERLGSTSEDLLVTDEQDHYSLAKHFLSLAGIHQVQVSGVEADDLIAHYWRIKENDERVIILSGDKDFLQLLDGWTEQIRPGGEFERWTSNRVRTEMKCKPSDLPKVMALTGDKIDGVPGIPGFGHKTACKALAQHEWDLTQLLTTNDPRWSKRLAGHHDEVIRNLSLVDLRTALDASAVALPPPPVFEPTALESAAWADLEEWLGRYELASVLNRLHDGSLWVDPQQAGRQVLDWST